MTIKKGLRIFSIPLIEIGGHFTFQCYGGVAVIARAAEMKSVPEVEVVNCRNLLSDFKSRYGSYYTAQFPCFVAYFSDILSSIYLIVGRNKCISSSAKRTVYVTLNVTIYERKELRCPTKVQG